MRSKWLGLAMVVTFGGMLVRCDSQSERIFDVCETLERCTGYIDDGTCGPAVEAAIDDGRLTTSNVAQCARCLGSHAPPDGAIQNKCPANDAAPASGLRVITQPPSVHDVSCRRILSDRVCDTACSGVTFVARARTSVEMREEMCRQASRCGDSSSEALCLAVTRGQLACHPLEAQLDTDADLANCRNCIVKPSDVRVTGDDTAVCQLLVDACSEPCRKTGVSNTLSLAKVVLQACAAEGCFSVVPSFPITPDPSSGGGGVGGEAAGAPPGSTSAGEGGAAGAPDLPPDPCFKRMMDWLSESPNVASESFDPDGEGGAGPTLTSRQKVLALCAGCVADKDCSSATKPCRDVCAPLPFGVAP